MNREIKFRAKAYETTELYKIGEWVYGYFYQTQLEECSRDGVIPCVDMCFIVTEDFYHIRVTDLAEQFTGLTDKNGVEIYEGDVLFDAHREEYATVIFEDGCFVAEFETNTQNLEDVLADDDVELVGSIHETPEMLSNGE